ncbi:IS30 family transposase [Mycobacterium sp. 852002-51057_SCH5723018]|uniref:IS30 family transposase n=1 Tax=Mycobacterium sp. 852002-51057_SCH5723018 TaxID=1834094 RepID=UPI001E3C5EEC|nr:IS30 family transposase [Mycobacterium sp. 852002-51057_SCH5723018]
MAGYGPLVSVERRFWELIAAGMTPTDAGPILGVSAALARAWVRHRGGVNPQLTDRSGRRRPRLSIAEREMIMVGVAAKKSIRAMAKELGRHPSTVMREIALNGGGRGSTGRYRRLYRFGANCGGWDARVTYQAHLAQARSQARARRPKIGKIGRCEPLRVFVEQRLNDKHSPRQIAGVLARTFPDDPEMRVSHETIYRALYVQGRGELRRELTTCLRTGRALRKPHRSASARRTRIPDMVTIAERPAEVEDRAVPGHWEGDLIVGKDQRSQIGTLVERSSGFVMLLHLPGSRHPTVVAQAMIETMRRLPATLRRTLTWDQGLEMAHHAHITMATDMPIYFCDPHSPWQRGSNENTNGLLRQYFPKGTDLSVYGSDYLDYVAMQLNNRPRERFGFDTPAQVLNRVLSNPTTTTVATKP